MIVDRIYDYLNGDKDTVSEEALELAASLIKSSLRRNFGKDREGGARQPSPSSKWGCDRRMYLDADASVPRERVTARSLVAFTLGDMLEQAAIIMARQAMGEAVVSPDRITGRQHEIHMEHGDVEIAGHIDMTIWDEIHGEMPVDWKSMAVWSFGDFTAAATDPTHKWWAENRDGYIAQVRWYMMGMGAKRGYLCAICKNTGHMAEIEIRDDPMENERLVRKLIEIHGAIRANALPDMPDWAAKAVVRNNVEMPGGGRGKCLEMDTKATPGFSWACGYCPYTTQTCFPGFSVVPLGRPVYRKKLTTAQ